MTSIRLLLKSEPLRYRFENMWKHNEETLSVLLQNGPEDYVKIEMISRFVVSIKIKIFKPRLISPTINSLKINHNYLENSIT